MSTPGRLIQGEPATYQLDEEPETVASAARRKEVNTGEDGFRRLRLETGLVNAVPARGASERGARGKWGHVGIDKS